MAWKELLRQQDEKETRPAETDGDASRDGGSLIRQICGNDPPVSEPGAAWEPGREGERVSLPDGYVRRSPVQRYRTSPDYMRKRVQKIIVIVVALCLVALLVLALLKSDMLKF